MSIQYKRVFLIFPPVFHFGSVFALCLTETTTCLQQFLKRILKKDPLGLTPHRLQCQLFVTNLKILELK